MFADIAAYLASLGSNNGVAYITTNRVANRQPIATAKITILFFMAYIVYFRHDRIIVVTLPFGNTDGMASVF
jgi:hypothetical protein